jgi:putative restriction endonuclease
VNSPDQADSRVAQFRASLRLQGARRAFDVLLGHANGTNGFRMAPPDDVALNEMRYVEAASGECPFSLSAAEGEMMFDVHEPGFRHIPGGLPALEAGLGSVSEVEGGTWRVRISTPAQAEALSRLIFSLETRELPMVRHWWANLADVDRPEIQGGYLWGRKRSAGGSRNPSQQNLTRIVPGDIVFAHTDGLIAAIGVAVDRARGAPDPKLADGYGWLVPVRFITLNESLRLKDHLFEIKRHRPAKQSPLRGIDNAKAAALLAELSGPDAKVLRRLLNGQVEDLEQRIAIETDGRLAEQAVEEQIWQRTDIGPSDKRHLTSARFGAGVFRENVERIETACRVTGILDRRYLRATHIKPWKDSDDQAKVDGANGLLLSPHIILLFDRGHISFADDGTLMISRHLNPYVRRAWSMEHPVLPHAFRPEQRGYLDYHRAHVFERVGGGRRAPGETAM